MVAITVFIVWKLFNFCLSPAITSRRSKLLLPLAGPRRCWELPTVCTVFIVTWIYRGAETWLKINWDDTQHLPGNKTEKIARRTFFKWKRLFMIMYCISVLVWGSKLLNTDWLNCHNETWIYFGLRMNTGTVYFMLIVRWTKVLNIIPSQCIRKIMV